MSKNGAYEDSIESWQSGATALARFGLASEQAKIFLTDYKKFMTPGERLEVAELVGKMERTHFSQWQTLVRKIRGLNVEPKSKR